MRGQNSKPKINIFRNFFATNFGLCEKVSDLKLTKIKKFLRPLSLPAQGIAGALLFSGCPNRHAPLVPLSVDAETEGPVNRR